MLTGLNVSLQVSYTPQWQLLFAPRGAELFQHVGQSVMSLWPGNFNCTCSSFSFSVALVDRWKNATMGLGRLYHALYLCRHFQASQLKCLAKAVSASPSPRCTAKSILEALSVISAENCRLVNGILTEYVTNSWGYIYLCLLSRKRLNGEAHRLQFKLLRHMMVAYTKVWIISFRCPHICSQCYFAHTLFQTFNCGLNLYHHLAVYAWYAWPSKGSLMQDFISRLQFLH